MKKPASALFAGLADNSGILITLERIDSAGKSVSVARAASTSGSRSLTKSLAGQAITDATGTYSLEGLTDGNYNVYASSATSLEKAVSIGITVAEPGP